MNSQVRRARAEDATAICNGLHLKTPRPAIKAFSDQD